jgi:hypothetical protein
MRPSSLDDWFETFKYKFECRGQALPRRWRLFYRLVRRILRWEVAG